MQNGPIPSYSYQFDTRYLGCPCKRLVGCGIFEFSMECDLWFNVIDFNDGDCGQPERGDN